MAFAILRIGKISSASKATAADAHNERSYEVKNANPEKRHLNAEYVKMGERPTWELANERIEAVGIKPKADAVRVVEFLLAASPEFFQPGEDIRDSDYLRANLKFMQERYGPNLLSFTLHQDETTPHFQCMVVPITTEAKTVTLKNGQEHTRSGHRLTAAELFNPKTLRQLQTDYAEAVAPFGLARGAEKSPTKHQEIKRVYGLNRQVHELDVIARQGEAIKSKVVELSGQQQRLSEENQRLVEALAQQRQQIAQLVAQRDDQQKKAQSLADEVERLSEQRKTLDRSLVQLSQDKNELTTEIGRQRQQITKLGHHSDDLLREGSNLVQQIKSLTAQGKGLETLVKQLNQDKASLRADIKTLTTQNAQLVSDNELQRQNLTYLKTLANQERVKQGKQAEKIIEPPRPELTNSPNHSL